MTKLEFMKELESLLPDIPLEERDEALQYYNGYFEDAGEDHEAEIMKELGSPKRVAAIIKADLNSNAADRENRGYFTENGYQDTIYDDEKLEIVSAVKKENNNSEQANNANSTGQSKNYNQGASGAGNQYNKQNTNSNTGLFILIGILSFPIWLPIVLSIFGVAIGVAASILGIIFGFGVAGIAMIAAGIALLVAGMIQISVPLIGLLLCGSGLLIIGLGMLFTLASGFLCQKVLPALVKGFVNLCRLPFKNRSVIA